MKTTEDSNNLKRIYDLEKQIGKLQSEKLQLNKKLHTANQKILDLQKENNNLQKQFNIEKQQMIDSHNQIILNKKTEFEKQYENIFDDNLLIPKKEIKKIPFLQYLIEYCLFKKVNPQFKKMCFLAYYLNKKCYEAIRNFIPLIPSSEIRSENSDLKKNIKDDLLDIHKIPTILHNLCTPSEPIHVTIAGDAASITPVAQKGENAIYTYMILPVKKEYKTFPLHVELTTNGSSNEAIVKIFWEICDIVKKSDYAVDFISTDGDTAFDQIHLDWFEKVINPILMSEGIFY